MIFKKSKVLYFSLFYLILVVLNYYSVFNYEFLPACYTRPLLILLMIVMHLTLFKKLNVYFLLSQITTLIGDIFQYNHLKDYFVESMVFYTLGQVFLITALFQITKRKWIKSSYPYLILCLLIFAVVFGFVIKDFKHNYSIVLFALCFVVTSTLTYIHCIKNMNKYNLTLLAANIVSVLTAVTTTINLESIEKDVPVLFVVTTFAALAHYFFCLGFYFRDKHLFLNNKK